MSGLNVSGSGELEIDFSVTYPNGIHVIPLGLIS